MVGGVRIAFMHMYVTYCIIAMTNRLMEFKLMCLRNRDILKKTLDDMQICMHRYMCWPLWQTEFYIYTYIHTHKYIYIWKRSILTQTKVGVWHIYVRDILMLLWQFGWQMVLYVLCMNMPILFVPAHDIFEYKYIDLVYTIYSGWIWKQGLYI